MSVFHNFISQVFHFVQFAPDLPHELINLMQKIDLLVISILQILETCQSFVLNSELLLSVEALFFHNLMKNIHTFVFKI